MAEYWFNRKKVFSWKGYMFFVIIIALELVLGYLFNFTHPTSGNVVGFLFSLTMLLLLSLLIAMKKSKK